MFDDVFTRGIKRPNRPFIESSCGIGHIRFFQWRQPIILGQNLKFSFYCFFFCLIE